MVNVKHELPPQQKIDKNLEKKITSYQRKYRNYANGRYSFKEDKNKERYLEKNLETSGKEKKTVKTLLNVAMGTTHTTLYNQNLKKVESHVACQQQYQKVIENTKQQVEHLHYLIKQAEKSVTNFNKIALTDFEYNYNVSKAKKELEMIENRVDVSKRNECELIAENSELRKKIHHMVHERSLFNKMWQKLIIKLAADKRFYLDLAESAIMAFNQGSDLCFKLEALNDKIERDKKLHVREMKDLIRKLDADRKIKEFISVKGKVRDLFDLEEREYKRRAMFRDEHNKKLNLYNYVIEKIKTFYKVEDVNKVIETFTRNEEEFFAHFNYMNELNNQVDTLQNSVVDYSDNIDALNAYNKKKDIYEKQLLENFRESLRKENFKTELLSKKSSDYKAFIGSLLKTVTQICRILKCDDSSLLVLLGDYSQVTKFNVKRFLTILENKLNEVLGVVFYSERKDREGVTDELQQSFVVRGVEREKEDPTSISEIVLVQQCAECAEGEDVNRYDEEIVYPLESEDVRNKVREKVKAPEIQYRLHSISKCRLPRSRLIVNKRYM